MTSELTRRAREPGVEHSQLYLSERRGWDAMSREELVQRVTAAERRAADFEVRVPALLDRLEAVEREMARRVELHEGTPLRPYVFVDVLAALLVDPVDAPKETQ